MLAVLGQILRNQKCLAFTKVYINLKFFVFFYIMKFIPHT